MNVQTAHGFNVLHSRDVLTHLDLMNVDVMPIMSGMVSNVNVSLHADTFLYNPNLYQRPVARKPVSLFLGWH